MLRFPPLLEENMRRPDRTYCLYAPDNHVDTEALLCILDDCKARRLGHDDSKARIVFIHNSMWSEVQKNSFSFVMRRTRADIQFFRFGVEPSIPPAYYPIHEIFAIGGIMTITPQAIVEGAGESLERLITLTHQSPFWDAYILPNAIGMVDELAKKPPKNGGPAIVDYPTALTAVLLPIHNRFLAVSSAPPSLNDYNEYIDWSIDQVVLSDLDSMGLLSECRTRFKACHGENKNVEGGVRWEVINDMRRMQEQPALQKTYRRFVVIVAESEWPHLKTKGALNGALNGIEVNTVSKMLKESDPMFLIPEEWSVNQAA
ncbi:hypothetical protein BOTBODRAFT_146564 [Botryobasidium botryosum FD-172 SS1]|uniref:Uncharacterized protein n=1 Tax=Botryobasidium botryosum (strain FD-172 SS1) TaxID=930990 RepID=A0A067MLQ4_BOTB1|nr:hypothetical protein BOTBODRAFT_146564 [Botryobasidium botryosum FD-172 SS1]